MKVLIIHQEEEEITRAIVEMTTDEFKFFTEAHNYIVNVSNHDADKHRAHMTISGALSSNEEYKKYCGSDIEKYYFGKWVKFIDNDNQDLSDVDVMISTEFMV